MSTSLLKSMTTFGRAGQPFLNVGNRPYASRADCAKDQSPRCSPKKMAATTCEDKRESKWFNPKCCLEPCSDAMPRFDEMYYKPSNKLRQFTRTWVECPNLLIKPKKVCCFDKLELPPMEFRPRKKVPDNCKTSPASKNMMKCNDRAKSKCPKWSLPGCAKARDPPRCFELRKAKVCKKVCAPFPAFSECSRPKPKPRHPSECRCWRLDCPH